MGIKAEVQSGKVVGGGTGPEGERGGKSEGKRGGGDERGPKAHSKNSDFGTPLIEVLFSSLPTAAQQERDGGLRCDTGSVLPT